MRKAKAKEFKEFGGKRYKIYDLYPNKHKALIDARELRRDEIYARVVNTPDGWAVYWR